MKLKIPCKSIRFAQTENNLCILSLCFAPSSWLQQMISFYEYWYYKQQILKPQPFLEIA